MKKKILLLFSFLSFGSISFAQPPQGNIAVNPVRGGDIPQMDSWEVTINPMGEKDRDKINRIVDGLQSKGGATRSVLSDMLLSSLSGGVSGLVDVFTTQVINLAQYRKSQKQKWMQMIQRECNYTDSISSIRGLKDFYSDVSTYGALDPSNINFDGISIRGMREGQEALYLSCHIDQNCLDHMFQHSKFKLVLDTLVFHPYSCHLPNLQANGIRLARDSKATMRDNSFSFDERQNLCVGIEMTLSSSWINEAVMVMDNVELGRFQLNLNIDAETPMYIYSRRQIDANRQAGLSRDTTYVAIEGDCFVVPRSYMPISGGKRMWGTGEYNIKVKFRESCQFNNDKERNKKMKKWYKDYKQLRKMQAKGKREDGYFRTVWKQNGNTLIKQMLQSGLSTGIRSVDILSGGGTSMGAAAAMGGAMPSGGSATQGNPGMPGKK